MKAGKGLLFFEAAAAFWALSFQYISRASISSTDVIVGLLLCLLVTAVTWIIDGCQLTRAPVEKFCFVWGVGALVCGLMLFLIDFSGVASLRASITLYGLLLLTSAYAAKHYQKASVKMMIFFVVFMPIAGLGAIKISFAMLLIATTAYFIPALTAVECAQDASLYNLFKPSLTLREMVRVAARGVAVGATCMNCGAAILPMRMWAARWALIFLSAIVSAIAARYYYIESECREK